MNIWRKWLWDKSGFTLGIAVLSGLVSGWGLPETANLTFSIAMMQIAMAIVAVIKGSIDISKETRS
jgi:hypothetical protein